MLPFFFIRKKNYWIIKIRRASTTFQVINTYWHLISKHLLTKINPTKLRKEMFHKSNKVEQLKISKIMMATRQLFKALLKFLFIFLKTWRCWILLKSILSHKRNKYRRHFEIVICFKLERPGDTFTFIFPAKQEN